MLHESAGQNPVEGGRKPDWRLSKPKVFDPRSCDGSKSRGSRRRTLKTAQEETKQRLV